MFTETAGSRKAIGDVDVLYHEGLYHLFHLVLPNHDFIAHAVSTDGLNWRRVNNALFSGDPGSWDDLMLWTMHVSPDPLHEGHWRMFYTGLSRRDQGRYQRIGMAVSDDLYHWRKAAVHWQDGRGAHDPPAVKRAVQQSRSSQADDRHALYDEQSYFPLEPDPQFYESSLEEPRGWVSFRDPYYVFDGERGWLLVAGRVHSGPLVRRGCVAVMQEQQPGEFKAYPALYHPRLYDDIEVPSILQIEGEYYLIGSIREDAKIRYWHTDKLGNPWRSYHDNVLLPQGNYAGRICRDPAGWLLWNFYSMHRDDRTKDNLLPPPKRLRRTADGLLRPSSFEGLDAWLEQSVSVQCIRGLTTGLEQEYCSTVDGQLEVKSESGFHAFVFDEPLSCFRFRATLQMHGRGKCGLVFRIDPSTHDGYYLSLDLVKGIAQLRSWGTGPAGSGEEMMQFASLQAGYWHSVTPGQAEVQLIAFGSYFEFSVGGQVILSLADQLFTHGLMGVYLETAHLHLRDIELNRMRSPWQSDEHLVSG
ncbi:MAG: glycosyl hydrolase [Planctomycetales bacterium]|nr:glycosyl hydrolase [Planctomycetales bacterium]